MNQIVREVALHWCPNTAGSEWREIDNEKERDKWEMKVIAKRNKGSEDVKQGAEPSTGWAFSQSQPTLCFFFKQSFIGAQSCPLADILSMAALVL